MGDYIFVEDGRVVGSYTHEGPPPLVTITPTDVSYSGGTPARDAKGYRDEHHPDAAVYLRVADAAS